MSLFISSFKRLFKERLLLLIPVLVIFIVVFHYITPKSDNYRVLENNSFWMKKTFDKVKYDIVIAGDSRVYRGISPNHMKEKLPGNKIVNFGYGSAGLSNVMLSEVEKRINYSSKNKAVVLGVTPLTLTKEGEINGHLNTSLSTKKEELIELLYFKKVFQFFIPFTLNQMADCLGGKEFKSDRKQEYIAGGWVATEVGWSLPETAIKSYSTRFIDNQVKERVVDELVAQIKKWSKNNVKVFALRPPTTHKMITLEDSLSGYIEDSIKLKIENAGGIWLDFSVDNYQSYDGSHLDKSNAIKFSYELADKLKPYLNVR